MDLVVGVQWLKSLDPVLTNYATLTMKFMNHGRLVKLRGDRENVIHDVTHHQLRHMIQSKGVSALFHNDSQNLSSLPTKPPELLPNS